MSTVHRCLACYAPLADAEQHFHSACSRRMFGSPLPPELPYSETDMLRLGLQVVRAQIAVTGVQPKLSLDIERVARATAHRRFTIVGLWGRYIFKPPSSSYPHLPEVEDCTMHLAEIAGIRTVPHTLLRMQSGHLAYIARRIDRTRTGMLHMEDMCQITGRLTEHKYRGSHEQIAKAILRHSANPLFDAGVFFEQVVFSFLAGNADMHLKNFSLIDRPGIGWSLAPAYDLVATTLVNPADTEELALTLDGRKRNITRQNLLSAMQRAGLDESTLSTMLEKFQSALPAWIGFIRTSFLPPKMHTQFIHLITERAKRLGM